MDTSHHIDDDLKGEKGHHEHIEAVPVLDANVDVKDTIKGTVGLTGEGGEVVLLPAPSADPSGKPKEEIGKADHTLITRHTLVATLL